MIIVNNKKLSAQEASVALADISKHSHKIFRAICDFSVNEKCRKEYDIQYRDFVKYTSNNNGQLPCIFCSRTLKFSGRNNPNTKYTSLNDNYFAEIKTEEQAYLLGWIASDGHIGKRGFKIAIKQSDKNILEKMRNYFCPDLPVRDFDTDDGKRSSLEANSIKISKDLCHLLKIKPGKKSDIVRLPELDEKYLWHFIRGYFDGDGTVNDPNKTCKKYPIARIRSTSEKMLIDLKKAIDIKSYVTIGQSISWEKRFAWPFLEKMYENATIWLPRKRNRFEKWIKQGKK
jgi:hypothetical protein